MDGRSLIHQTERAQRDLGHRDSKKRVKAIGQLGALLPVLKNADCLQFPTSKHVGDCIDALVRIAGGADRNDACAAIWVLKDLEDKIGGSWRMFHPHDVAKVDEALLHFAELEGDPSFLSYRLAQEWRYRRCSGHEWISASEAKVGTGLRAPDRTNHYCRECSKPEPHVTTCEFVSNGNGDYWGENRFNCSICQHSWIEPDAGHISWLREQARSGDRYAQKKLRECGKEW